MTTIYLDMDGVLADFESHFLFLFGVFPSEIKKLEQEEQAKFYIQLANTNFFSSLRKFNYVDLFISSLNEFSICSSPLRYDREGSSFHKKKWLFSNLKKEPKSIEIIGDKTKFAVNSFGEPNILVDDSVKNIARWNAAGGVGFLFIGNEIEKLKITGIKEFAEKLNKLSIIL